MTSSNNFPQLPGLEPEASFQVKDSFSRVSTTVHAGNKVASVPSLAVQQSSRVAGSSSDVEVPALIIVLLSDGRAYEVTVSNVLLQVPASASSQTKASFCSLVIS